MSEGPEPHLLEVPPRKLPIPGSVSPEARAVLALGPLALDPYPEPVDLAGWRRFIADSEKVLLELLTELEHPAVGEDRLEFGGVPVFVAEPAGMTAGDPRVYLEIHGGGLVLGGGECCRGMGVFNAVRLGLRVVSPDYRLPPSHLFPAGVEDCLSVYRCLLDRLPPSQIVVGGSSAGGNLAMAMLLRARDEGLPLPAALVLISPQVDLTESGDSFRVNLGVDTVLTGSLMNANRLYAGGADLENPYVSPLFADFTLGFPPTFLGGGTRDLFLSNTVRLHRALRSAGVPADLYLLEACPHGGFMADTPEDEELESQRRAFIDTWCPPPERKSAGTRDR